MIDPKFGRPVPTNVLAEVMSGWWRPRSDHKHAGIDIPLREGTPILSVGDGTVVRVQPTARGDAAGIYVAVEHPSGITSRYMHLSKVAATQGRKVKQGDVIGYSGNTGVANTGPHLHFDLKAKPAILPAIAATVGKPSTGWAPLMEPIGYGIPSEPWIPVDKYIDRTAADAKSMGIPLYKDRVGSFFFKVAMVSVVAWAASRVIFK